MEKIILILLFGLSLYAQQSDQDNKDDLLIKAVKDENVKIMLEIMLAQREELVEKKYALLNTIKELKQKLQIQDHKLTQQKRSNKKELESAQKKIREQKILIQEHKIFNSALQKQYDKMWKELKSNFDNHNLIKIYQKASVLQRNYNIFEIVIKKNNTFQITHVNYTYTEKCNSQEEIERFLDTKVPRSVHIDPSRSVFLVLAKPDSFLNGRLWLKEVLKKMRVVYDVQLLTE
ncbi:hypothetical protein [Candidatus Uabimicrobium sp. HlEnr_7]|uniref:hypothetical protein n=1 Tax=Candidatus Uabimicrobium helgolandensis TaxID=3095367 RepID=UPI003557AE63